ncbi:MAG: acyltransferase [Chloroflexota bacterium]
MKLNQLTFFRFLAGVIVVIFHFGRKTWIGINIPALTTGPFMVVFFFVLSGFIMTIAYGQQEIVDKGKYWVARFARIAPVYYLAIAIILIDNHLSGTSTDPYALNYSVFFLQAWFPKTPISINGPSWSLSVEMFFYLIFPFLIIFLKKISVFKASLITLVFWGITFYVRNTLNYSPTFDYVDPDVMHAIVFNHPLIHLASFMLGVVGGLIYVKYLLMRKISNLVSSSLVIFSFILIAITLTYRTKLFLFPNVISVYAVCSLLFLAFILALSIDHSWISSLLSNKFLLFLGELGYSIYILQVPFHLMYLRYIAPWIKPTKSQDFYIFLILLIILSMLTYTFLERPLRSGIRKAADKIFANLQKPRSELT